MDSTWRRICIVRIALRALWRARFRSGLMIATATLGVGGVILSVNMAAGGRRQVLDQIRRMGTNVIVVSPRASRGVAGRARTALPVTTLVEPDRVAIRREVPAIARTAAVATGSFRLKAGDLSKETAVVGCEPDYFRIKDWTVARGTAFDDLDERRAARLAMLGASVARDLYGSQSPLGMRLSIGGAPFEVIGILAERGQGLDATNEDDQVYVPLRTAMHRLMNRDSFASLLLETGLREKMTGAGGRVEQVLRQRHRRPGKLPDDFEVTSAKALAAVRLAASESLAFYVCWIGRSALAVSGLGILAVGWISVRGRTAEIGTRRAIGATAADIFLQIFAEAGVISLLGCLVGLVAGWQGSRLAAAGSGLPYVFDRQNAAWTLLTAALVNLGFSILPARRASTISPLRALRYE